MRDDSKYGKILRRVVDSCFAVIMLLFTSAAIVAASERILGTFFDDSSEEYYNVQYLSKGATYYNHYWEDGFVKNADGKKRL